MSFLEEDGVRYTTMKNVTPKEINRAKVVGEPLTNGEQKSYGNRSSDLLATFNSSGEVPSVDEPAYQVGENTLKNLTKYGEVSARGRNIEMQFLPGIVNQLGIAGFGWLGFARVHEPFDNVAGYIYHRTDNPLVFPFARSQSAVDILLSANGKISELNLGALPGHCMQYDQMQGHGLSGAMGVAPNGNFGLLSKVHPDNIGRGVLTSNANERKCLKGGGSVYPLINFVAGGENFKAAFYTRFLRMSKLIDLYSILPLVPKAPMFHQYKDYGSVFQSKIQIHDASFPFNNDPHRIDANTLDSHWTNPHYDNKRTATSDSDGLNIDIARGNMWVGIDACRRGYYPIIVLNGNWIQIRGDEKYSG
jgi:hypothetical protein